MTAVTSTGTSTGPSLVVNGLVSGITTPKVIDALLEAYQEPITNLEEKQTSLNVEAADYRTIATALQAVQTASEALSTQSQWDLATATTSDSSVATAVAAAGAQTGSLTFTVDQLAQANVLASSGGVASEGELVTSAPSVLVATGGAGIGFSALTAGPSLGAGSYAISVTQSSAAAAVTGLQLGSTIRLTGTATLDLTVNGTNETLTVAGGTYTPDTLAAAITSAAGAAGVGVEAAVGTTGGLVLSTTRQGATASLTVDGGSAAPALGLTTGQSAIGTDAVVTVGGTTTTFWSITPGQVLTLGAPDGATISATVATSSGPGGALVRAGAAEAAEVSVGNGSLSSVVSAINASGLAATASAVQLASGDYILQVSADSTGTSGAVSVGASVFSGSPLGTLRTISTARDAEVSVGTSNGYVLSSATDTFTGILAGTSVTVASTGQATVTVTPDATGEASRVSALVTATNKALADIQKYAGYTTSTKTGGPLMGDAVVTDVKEQILSTFAGAAGTSSLGTLADVGISLTKTGTLTFTKEAFTTAFAASPTGVAALFTQGGSYTPSASGSSGDVSFAFAGTQTVAGSYAVAVSHSATQAVDAGATLSAGTISSAETLTVTMGSATATYATSVGQSLSSVANGLNAAFAGAKIDLTAEVVTGTQLQIVSDDYGTQASFRVASTASGTGTTGLASATAFAGTNVAGTIGGVAATGEGQVLSVPNGSGQLSGLGVVVTASGITTTTTLGTFSYRPGVAQQLTSAMSDATNAQTGSITSAVKGLTTQATGLNSQISMYERLESEQRTVLEQQFATMETNLSKLQNESSELTNEIDDLTTTTG